MDKNSLKEENLENVNGGRPLTSVTERPTNVTSVDKSPVDSVTSDEVTKSININNLKRL